MTQDHWPNIKKQKWKIEAMITSESGEDIGIDAMHELLDEFISLVEKRDWQATMSMKDYDEVKE